MPRRPRSVKKVYIPQTIAAEIGARILSGALKPDMNLGTEAAASDDRLISRPAYREAIRTLVAKGLVQAWPRSGTRVTQRTAWHLLDPEVLHWMFAHNPKLENIVALFELRGIIEPQIVALAARRRTLNQLVEMGAALEMMGRATLKSEEGRQADIVFHEKLIEACGNPFLISLRSSVTAAITGSTLYKYKAGKLNRDPMPEHLRVFEAVAAGDSEAGAEAMRELIRWALNDALPGVKPGRIPAEPGGHPAPDGKRRPK